MTLPEELKALPNWVCWGKVGYNKPKMPWNPVTGHGASASDPATWTTYPQAVDAVERGQYTGVGFEFGGSGFMGIDFDHCRNAETGEIIPQVLEWLQKLDSYTEVSLSGHGFHVIARGRKHDQIYGAPNNKIPVPEWGQGFDGTVNEYGQPSPAAVEMYDNAHYFALTGNQFSNDNAVNASQDAADALFVEVSNMHLKRKRPPQRSVQASTGYSTVPPPLSDEQILQKARNSSNIERATRFKDLYDFGQWEGRFPSQSEADMSLLNDIAFYTTDPDQIDRLYRGSALMRDDWDVVHYADGGTYGEHHVKKALTDTQNHYKGRITPEEAFRPLNGDYTGSLNWDGTPEDGAKKRLKIVPLEDIEAQRADYLIYPYFPRGKLTIVGGVSGSTKTWFVLSVAAILSNGGLFISDDPCFTKRPPGVTIYQTKENDYNTDIRPRLDKLGANVSNIVMIDERDTDGMGDSLSLSDTRIAEACKLLNPYMIVFDPIQSYLGANVDMHKANEVRPILDKLIDVAKRYNCAVVLISHMSKMVTAAALDRLLGSSDFRNAARSILVVGSDPQDRESRVVVHAKNSLGVPGQSIRYHIDDKQGVVYDGFCDLTEDEIVQPARTGKRGRPADAIGVAITQLEKLFEGRDAVPYDEVKTLQTMGGISDGTLSNARKSMKLKSAVLGQQPNRKSWWVRPHVNVKSFLAEKRKEEKSES